MKKKLLRYLSVIITGIVIVSTMVPSSLVFATAIDGDIDTSFSIGSWFDGWVLTTLIQSDHHILVGWTFKYYEWWQYSPKLIRLNPDWAPDWNFHVWNGFNGSVNALVIDTNGYIIVWGDFTGYDWYAVNHIARIQPNWNFDSTFNNWWSGLNGSVHALAIDSNGSILIGGNFSSYNWITANNIVRIKSNWGFDWGFYMWSGFNAMVNAIAIQSDGKIIVGWAFSQYQWVSAHNIVRLRFPDWGNAGLMWTGFNKDVNSLAIDSNNTIYAGGQFTSYNWQSTPYMAHLLSDWNLDGGFNNANVAWWFDSPVLAITLKTNDDIFLGWWFTSYNWISSNHILRIDSMWNVNSNFTTWTGFNNGVTSISLQDDGNPIVGWWFTNYQWTTTNYITKLVANTVYGGGSSGGWTPSWPSGSSGWGNIIWNLRLDITKTAGSCVYGTSLYIGAHQSQYAAYDMTGDTFSGAGASTLFSCKDTEGLSDWTMTMQASGTLKDGVSALHDIPANNVSMVAATNQVTAGSCTTGTNLNTWGIIGTTPGTILHKSWNIGDICTIDSTSVNLAVHIDAHQAVGTYTGTLVLNMPF